MLFTVCKKGGRRAVIFLRPSTSKIREGRKRSFQEGGHLIVMRKAWVNLSKCVFRKISGNPQIPSFSFCSSAYLAMACSSIDFSRRRLLSRTGVWNRARLLVYFQAFFTYDGTHSSFCSSYYLNIQKMCQFGTSREREKTRQFLFKTYMSLLLKFIRTNKFSWQMKT